MASRDDLARILKERRCGIRPSRQKPARSSRLPRQQHLGPRPTEALSPALRCTTLATLAARVVGLTFAESVELPTVAEATGLPGSREALALRFRRFLQHPDATRQVCRDPLLPRLQAAQPGPARPDPRPDPPGRRLHRQRRQPGPWPPRRAPGLARHPRSDRVDRGLPAGRGRTPVHHRRRPATRPDRTVAVTLLADSGLARSFLIDQRQHLGWHWGVRLAVTAQTTHLFRRPGDRGDRTGPSSASPPGCPTRRSRHAQGAIVKCAGGRAAWGTVHVDPEHVGPGVLFSDLADGASVVRRDRQRMQIEGMIAEGKRRRWHLTQRRLRVPRQLAALLIGIALAQQHPGAAGPAGGAVGGASPVRPPVWRW